MNEVFGSRASIVASMISVLVDFALMQVAKARQDITRENDAVQFAAYLEKGAALLGSSLPFNRSGNSRGS